MLRYRTRTGALLRVDGEVAGAFDAEHEGVPLAPSARERALTLEVDEDGLPASGLPSRPPRFPWESPRRREEPETALELVDAPPRERAAPGGTLPLLAHAHLDVAWLWTVEETRRKAARTFATAVRQLEADPAFVFVQSQPQLYAFVERDEPELFARVAALAREGRIDAGVASFWVEPDANLPSGESLLRQLAFGTRYAREQLGTEPSIAWLPDTFGFPNTLPTLLEHAGLRAFMSAKLAWNDTTRFPHARFRWRGPDGSIVTAALFASYGGPLDDERARVARERGEPLVVGTGDGGGGVSDEALAAAPAYGAWTGATPWFGALEQRGATLPTHEGELYLEYHRGVLTTHRDVKLRNAALERGLDEAEELCAWCVAVGAPASMTGVLRKDLEAAWTIVLRNQFHDVLAGTSSDAVYAGVRAEYARAEELVARITEAARSILPRSNLPALEPRAVAPVREDGDVRFDNGFVRARVSEQGTLLELATAHGRNVIAQGNVLAAYVDKPKAWEAWNLDPGYEKRRRRVRPQGAEIVDDGLQVKFALGGSRLLMRIALHEDDPFLRVDLAAVWQERQTLLRCEQWLALDAREGTFGTPHGTLARTAFPESDAERAKFEVPGQRYARVTASDGTGVAVLAPDLYGWSLRGLERGGLHLGTSLIRGTRWPDPSADTGEASFSFAYAPYEGVPTSAIERAWQAYAYPARVPLFACDDPAVIVVATKPAGDGDGVVVRVRECDGGSRRVRMRCAGRARSVVSVDALERERPDGVALEDGAVAFTIAPYALRSFRVRF